MSTAITTLETVVATISKNRIDQNPPSLRRFYLKPKLYTLSPHIYLPYRPSSPQCLWSALTHTSLTILKHLSNARPCSPSSKLSAVYTSLPYLDLPLLFPTKPVPSSLHCISETSVPTELYRFDFFIFFCRFILFMLTHIHIHRAYFLLDWIDYVCLWFFHFVFQMYYN